MGYELINGLGVYMGEICEQDGKWVIFNAKGGKYKDFTTFSMARMCARTLGYIINE